MIDLNTKGKGAVKEKFKLRHLLRHRLDVHLRFHPEFKTAPINYKNIALMFPVKDQGTSSSCGGQAFSSALEVAKNIRDGGIIPLSAKDIYSHCFLKGGGSQASTLINFVESQGADTEADVPSYNPDGTPMTEAQYETIATRNEDVALNQVVFNSFTYNGNDINAVKQAIDTGVTVCALLGNNVCWAASNGVVEVPTTTDWGHFLHLCNYDDTKQLVCCKNSWGTEAGDKGYYFIPYGYFSKNRVYGEWVLVLGASGQYISLLQKVVNLMQNIINLLKK